jgi:hypothetical protein
MTSTVPNGDSVLQDLREIWQKILGVPVDDPDANFFELGGDSLLALSIASIANGQGMEMPRTGILRRPTLRLLAEAVAKPELFDLI